MTLKFDGRRSLTGLSKARDSQTNGDNCVWDGFFEWAYGLIDTTNAAYQLILNITEGNPDNPPIVKLREDVTQIIAQQNKLRAEFAEARKTRAFFPPFDIGDDETVIWTLLLTADEHKIMRLALVKAVCQWHSDDASVLLRRICAAYLGREGGH